MGLPLGKKSKVCETHGFLGHSYFQDVRGDFYFVVSASGKDILAIKAYTEKPPFKALKLSVRMIDNRRYYRLLDNRKFCNPTVVEPNIIWRYYCPICAHICWEKKRKLRIAPKIADVSQVTHTRLGISGTSLLRSPDASDLDLVLYGVNSVRETAKKLTLFLTDNGAKCLRSWRRFVWYDSKICWYLRENNPPLRPENFPKWWEERRSIRLSLKVVDDISGCAFPCYYQCLTLQRCLGLQKGESVVLVSTRPGHSGLLHPGDQLSSYCLKYPLINNRVAVVDPCRPWIKIA